MVRSKINIKASIPASSIVEVLISMVVIMVVFGIAMMIYSNVMQSSLSVKKLRAQAVLNQTLKADESSANVASTSFTVDDLSIQQTIKSYGDENNLTEVDLAAYDANGKELITLHKVIINKNE
jgi:Tfp pilus assembly protein PilV